jgi:galactokinase
MQEPVKRAAAGFATHFGSPGAPEAALRFVHSPYRVCPLGAHVDHQDGWVSGMAIDHGVVVAFRPRNDTCVRAASADFPGPVTFPLAPAPPAVPGEWGNFLRGAPQALGREHALKHGVDLYVAGQLPVGGLSSSAAVAVGYLLALEAANDLAVTREDNVLLARAIENDYVGLRSGVLDQSMILLSERDRLLELDCRTGERHYVAFGQATDQAAPAAPTTSNAAPPAIVVVYSGLSHALVGTGYNRRVAECQEAAERLLHVAGMNVPEGGARLRDVPETVYAQHGAALPPELARRAAHYFGEQRRVFAGAEAWARGDAAVVGRLVSESGRSSIENYECGAPELIAIYDALLDAPGVYGARFSGAGFRGSCLALVDADAFDTITSSVRQRYLDAYPQYAQTFGVFRCASGDGARVSDA